MRRSSPLARTALILATLRNLFTVSIGSLHTVEGHRKRGLAKVIVSEISQQFVREFPQCPLPTGPIYIHADCEAYNDAAVKAFRRLAFDHTHFVSWVRVEIDFGKDVITS